MGVWAFLDFLLLAAGGVLIALSIIWKAPNLMMNMVFKPEFLTAGMILGIMLVSTVLVSIFAIIQANHITIGLVILNWLLIVDSLGIVTIGTIIWDYTLTERSDFAPIYYALSSAQQIEIQDMYSCCGYFNNTDHVVIGGKFCANQTFVSSFDPLDLSKQCVTGITDYADFALNNAFTTTYGFMAVALSLFLITLVSSRRGMKTSASKRSMPSAVAVALSKETHLFIGRTGRTTT